MGVCFLIQNFASLMVGKSCQGTWAPIIAASGAGDRRGQRRCRGLDRLFRRVGRGRGPGPVSVVGGPVEDQAKALGRIDAADIIHLLRILEVRVEPAADSKLEDPTARSENDLRSLSLDGSGATGAADDMR